MIYDIYLLQLVFHPVEAVGRLYKRRRETAVYKRRNNTEKNTKTRDT